MRAYTWGVLCASALIGFGVPVLAQRGTCLEGETLKDCEARLQRIQDREIKEGKDVRSSLEQAQEGAKKDAASAKKGTRKTGQTFQEGVSEDTASLQSAIERNERNMGELKGDEAVERTLVADPVAAVTGDGLNAYYMRPFAPKISGIGGLAYSRAENPLGSITSGTVTVGGDYYLVGQNNEGLRIGPRVFVKAGGDTELDNFFSTLGGQAELGYNYISRNGLTAGAGAGVGVDLNMLVGDNNDTGIDFSPYGRFLLGYSW